MTTQYHYDTRQKTLLCSVLYTKNLALWPTRSDGITLFITEMRESRRQELSASADQIVQALKRTTAHKPGEALSSSLIEQTFSVQSRSFNNNFGGFSEAPKFPVPHKLLFLLRYWKRAGNERALVMVEKPLTSMYRGGIYDHVGFGFHRYSIDAYCLVLHF